MKNSWLLLLKSGRRSHAGNLGYNDQDSSFYSWDNTVANHEGPSPGDGILIWDSETSLGASVIEKIKTSTQKKTRRRCPNCNSTGMKERTSKSPKFKCKDCRKEFDKAVEKPITVKTFLTHHEAGWLDLSGRFDAKTLRKLCHRPKSNIVFAP